MEKRLRLAKPLLKPDGALVVTIDEHEVHHLRVLLKQLFPEARRQVVTTVNNVAGVTQGGFSRVEEYALFCFFGDSRPTPMSNDLLSDEGQRTSPIRQGTRPPLRPDPDHRQDPRPATPPQP